MRRILICIAALAIMVFAPVAMAQSAPYERIKNVTTSTGSEKLLNQVAANASAASRTVTIDTDGWTDVQIQVDATRNAYTAIAITATCSINHGSSYGNVNSQEGAGSGAWNVYTATFTKTTSSTTNEAFNFGVGLCDHMKFTLAMTGGGAGDLADLYVKLGSI